jgi:hypothetical protein
MFAEDWDMSFLRYPARISLDKTGRIIQRVEIEDTIRVLEGEMEGTYQRMLRDPNFFLQYFPREWLQGGSGYWRRSVGQVLRRPESEHGPVELRTRSSDGH